MDPQCGVLGLEGPHGVVGQPWCPGRVRKGPSVGPGEADISAGAAVDYLPPPRVSPLTPTPSSFRILNHLDRESLFMHRPVMAPTKQDEVVEPGLSAIRPVLDVMRVTEAQPAAWEATASVPMVERPPDGGGDGPGLSAHVEHGTALCACYLGTRHLGCHVV